MDPKDDNKFFIIMEKQPYPRRGSAGSLCYLPQRKYDAISRTKEPKYMDVTCIGSYAEERILQSLSVETVGIFRINWASFVASGPRNERLRDRYKPISGTHFEIELQGNDKEMGQRDGGRFKSNPSFHRENYERLIVPFSRIRPPPAPQASSQAHSSHITRGVMVSYVNDEGSGNGIVVGTGAGIGETSADLLVCIDTDRGQITVPLNCVAVVTAEHQEPMEVLDASPASVEPQTGPATPLVVDSLVELDLSESCGYGVIRWIGHMPGPRRCHDDYRGVSDGMFKGMRYFSCAPNKALFVKLATCRPDSRFSEHSSANQDVAEEEAADHEGSCEELYPIDPIDTKQVDQILIGRMKGIQGHCNSCYMDSALFSSVLDSLLFKKMKPENSVIQNTLLRTIVNPLRRRVREPHDGHHFVFGSV
ncbi:Ubiquitin carboxyl-terminal hydrolase CYLD [Merluccius polli]|uniref:ubiquitinyl hydrolase 1 n=1 Tax=Merluccius polli TaxID=89951 RepID=A0AA47M9L1_MERPO|nr:Ubiquitin carboxyl-terminal hydrolase CYLD [Merluccius polli]